MIFISCEYCRRKVGLKHNTECGYYNCIPNNFNAFLLSDEYRKCKYCYHNRIKCKLSSCNLSNHSAFCTDVPYLRSILEKENAFLSIQDFIL